ncbi:hypothetical protein [Pedobacter nyackensis]|uniref:Uncharacterized protein n=1 Tax=Pedobacter nyackensis TaxID=475255 RepID=A0A1W2AHF3_9SPHI|nr:hypothetical protein [Pedobacter nyackensis]SMC60125.1 hypothetical protein SAMN04488101_101615 [Pedobacter nyackensis]
MNAKLKVLTRRTILVVSATLLPFIVFPQLQEDTIEKKPALNEGKLTIGLYFNGNETPGFPNRNIYLHANYCLEEIVLHMQRQDVFLSNEGKSMTSTKDSLTGYILTDFNRRMSWEFDASIEPPKLVNSFSIDAKRKGHNFKDNNYPNVNNELENYTFVKDTLIDNRTFKKIISLSEFKNDSSLVNKVSTVYLDKELKIRFYPLSKYLDDKFGGTSTTLEILTGANITKMEYKYHDGLSLPDSNRIKKYISLAEKNLIGL